MGFIWCSKFELPKHTEKITMMSKILVPLVLVLAISYVQADLQGYGHHHGHHHYPHDRDASADPDDYETDAAYAPPTPNNPPSGYGPPPANPPEYASPPSDTYGYGASDEVALPDLTPIIIAMLAIFGLSLLFPTFTEVETNGRKRRYANEYHEIARSDYVGRSFEIYNHLNAALQPVDRGCLEKITCEVGHLTYDVGLTSNPILGLVVEFLPGKYKTYSRQFVYPGNCELIECSAFP